MPGLAPFLRRRSAGVPVGPLPDAVRAAGAGRLVVITGGSRGIGAATATRFAAVGARLVLVARTSADLAAVRDRLARTGAPVHTLAVDLRDTDAARAAAERIVTEQGVPDVVVSGAGHSIHRALAESTDRFHDLQRTAGVNFLGAAAFLLPLLREMTARGSGHLVGVSTTTVDLPLPGWSAYAATKSSFDAWLSAVATRCRS